MANKTNLTINVILNILKQCCNIVFPLITYPYAARVLGDEALGRYSFSDSIITYFMVLAALGIPTYAIREGARIREDKKRISVFASEMYTINMLALIISYTILILFIVLVPRIQRDYIFMLILSINVITNVLGRDWINSIFEDFFYITVRYVFCQIICMVLLFIFVHDPSDVYLYTIIMLLSNAGGYVLNFFYTQKYVPVRFTKHINLKRHLKPILYLFCSTIAITIYIKSDITVLGFLRSDSEVGIYTLSSRIYMIVKALLNAVITVTIPRLANYLGTGDYEGYNSLINYLRKFLYVLVLPSIVGVYFLAPNIMLLLGGENYISGYESLRILCIALFFSVFGCYYAQGILVTVRKEKYFFIATIISAIVNVVCNIIIIPFIGMNGAALTTVVAEIIVLVICRCCSKDIVKFDKNRDLLSIIIGCFGIAVVCYLVQTIKINLVLQVSLSIFGSVILYFVTLVIFKNEIMLQVVKIITKRT